jgi:hypothetical protein
MARVYKLLLRPSLYSAPQGVLKATPARLKHWIRTFRRMKAKGIRVPIGHGHQPQALPGDASARARNQYYLGALNAGYLDALDLDKRGGLRAVLDCPGYDLDDKGNLVAWTRLGDGREVRTAIAEVSAAIRDWTDGTGETWPDAIVHIALTPLPVAHGTGPFTPAPIAPLEGIELSLSNRYRRLSNADDAYADDAIAQGKPYRGPIERSPGRGRPASSTRGPSLEDTQLERALRVLRQNGLHDAADAVEALFSNGRRGGEDQEERDEVAEEIRRRADRASPRPVKTLAPAAAEAVQLLLSNAADDSDAISTPAEGDDGDLLGKTLRVLDQHGLKLPADTDSSNLIERILTAGWGRYQDALESEQDDIERRAERASLKAPGLNGQSTLKDMTETQGPVMMSTSYADDDMSVQARAARVSRCRGNRGA